MTILRPHIGAKFAICKFQVVDTLYLPNASPDRIKKSCCLAPDGMYYAASLSRSRTTGWFNPFFRPSTYFDMPCLGSSRPILLAASVSLRPRSSLRSFHFSYLSNIVISTRRAFSIMVQRHDDLFDYTSGRWM